MDEGWLYGEWETGPWWAFHTKVKDGSRELICHNVTYYVLQICVLPFFPFSTSVFMICCAMKEKDVGSYGWLGLGTGMRGPQVFLVTTNFFVKSNYFLLVDVAAHMHCCRLH